MVYSFSQTQLFNQCPRKYQYKYIDEIKEKEFESSPDLILGHSVHKALENLYNQVNIFIIPKLQTVLDDFQEIRNTELTEATKEKELQLKGDQKLEDYQRRGAMYLTAYYQKYAPFTDIKVIATESRMSFTLDEAGNKKFRGIVDRIDKEGDTFYITDYKTNKNLPPQQKDEYIEQLTLYGCAVQQKYAKYFTNLKARLHYLHFDITDEREITNERLATVVKKYSDLIDQIESKKFEYNMGNKKAFMPKQNEYCRYCEYQNICPLRAHMKYDDQMVNEVLGEVAGSELGEKTIKGLVDEYTNLSKEEKEAKGQKDAIKELLVDYLEKNDLLKLFGNTSKISASQIENISITDKDQLRGILQELGIIDQVLEIDRFKFQSLVKDGKIDTEKIQKFIERKKSRMLKSSKL